MCFIKVFKAIGELEGIFVKITTFCYKQLKIIKIFLKEIVNGLYIVELSVTEATRVLLWAQRTKKGSRRDGPSLEKAIRKEFEEGTGIYRAKSHINHPKINHDLLNKVGGNVGISERDIDSVLTLLCYQDEVGAWYKTRSAKSLPSFNLVANLYKVRMLYCLHLLSEQGPDPRWKCRESSDNGETDLLFYFLRGQESRFVENKGFLLDLYEKTEVVEPVFNLHFKEGKDKFDLQVGFYRGSWEEAINFVVERLNKRLDRFVGDYNIFKYEPQRLTLPTGIFYFL
jgi:hypothetical protein